MLAIMWTDRTTNAENHTTCNNKNEVEDFITNWLDGDEDVSDIRIYEMTEVTQEYLTNL